MKIIKNTFTIIILSLLFILLVVSTFSYFTSTKQDEVDQISEDDTIEETTQKPYTESITQPERKPNISDIKYARALMSHPRSKITDINVLTDYDSVIKTATDNINKGVGNKEDYELYNIWEDMQDYEQTINN